MFVGFLIFTQFVERRFRPPERPILGITRENRLTLDSCVYDFTHLFGIGFFMKRTWLACQCNVEGAKLVLEHIFTKIAIRRENFRRAGVLFVCGGITENWRESRENVFLVG
jgi:hypothetical protein